LIGDPWIERSLGINGTSFVSVPAATPVFQAGIVGVLKRFS
jgi:hypothetical protein